VKVALRDYGDAPAKFVVNAFRHFGGVTEEVLAVCQ
jgi:hypothetical protein